MTPEREIGLRIPQILLPKPTIDLHKWAVIACDQFTSQPEYWQQVEEIVADAPSTYRMILPEVYLDTPEEEERVKSTQKMMQKYLESNIFNVINDFIYVIRTVDGKSRRGLMVCLDLEHYDYNKGAQTLIRATEGTILDRLPPRIRIREGAPLELPHILVLFDDPNDTVFGPIDDRIESFESLYDFDLMLGSGHLRGFKLADEKVQSQIFEALHQLVDSETFAEKYNLKPGRYEPLLFAMGDGNHSLATAKAIWEKIKPDVGMNHPARYALVEIENIHDPALIFEPIHRLLFGIDRDIMDAMHQFWGENLSIKDLPSQQAMIEIVDQAIEPWHQIGLINADGVHLIEISEPDDNLPVGTLQKFLDAFMEKNGARKIDYIHGTDILFNKASQERNAGFYVPGMDKSDLFKTVILDGALPRKTFSMGEAKEKRFYMECRQIQK
ncbi:MAG: DUF1015 domain-containing protein [Brevefilum sp.]